MPLSSVLAPLSCSKVVGTWLRVKKYWLMDFENWVNLEENKSHSRQACEGNAL